MKSERIILGIDPGTNVMGYSVVKFDGKKSELVCMGVLKLNKLDDHPLRLKKIFERVTELVNSYHPDEMAIEEPFFGKNVQSMLKLGRAQGVAMAAALHYEVPIFEYSPRKIKQAVTGNGNASKEQVARMLQQMLKFDDMPDYLDATDALAIAICHTFNFEQNNNSSSGSHPKKSYNSWSSFVNTHAERIKNKP